MRAAFAFLDAFELVFGVDWEYTKNALQIQDSAFVARTDTFIAPGIENEGDNWGNRAHLLASFRKFREDARRSGYVPLEERDIR